MHNYQSSPYIVWWGSNKNNFTFLRNYNLNTNSQTLYGFFLDWRIFNNVCHYIFSQIMGTFKRVKYMQSVSKGSLQNFMGDSRYEDKRY